MIKKLSKPLVDKFILFAQLTHTIGNFVLIPKKIEPYIPEDKTVNMVRASVWKDYFDLSLLWFMNNQELVWTDETLEVYFDKFMLQSYAQGRCIFPLMPAHEEILKGDYELESRPKTKKELAVLLDNINNRIIQRGKLMYSKLTGDKKVYQSEMAEDDVASGVYIKESKQGVLEGKKARKFLIKNYLYMFTMFFWSALLIAIYFYNMSVWWGKIIAVVLPSIALILPVFSSIHRKNIFIIAQYCRCDEEKAVKISKMENIISGKQKVIFFLVEVVIIVIMFVGFRGEELWKLLLFLLLCLEVASFPWKILYWVKAIQMQCSNCSCLDTLQYDTYSGREAEVIGYQDVWVPGKITTYKTIYVCKWCGKKHYFISEE